LGSENKIYPLPAKMLRILAWSFAFAKLHTFFVNPTFSPILNFCSRVRLLYMFLFLLQGTWFLSRRQNQKSYLQE